MTPEDNEFSSETMSLVEWLRGGWDGNDDETDDETGGN